MVSAAVTASVQQFIEYAQWVVTIMILYYVIKFFVVKPPTKEERESADAERRKRFGKFIDRVAEEGKADKEYRKRDREARGIKSKLIHTVNSCDDLLEEVARKGKRHVLITIYMTLATI